MKLGKRRKLWNVWNGCLAAALIASLSVAGCTGAGKPSESAGRETESPDVGSDPAESSDAEPAPVVRTVTILQTSDIHGFLNSHDYSSDMPADHGLSKAAALIKSERQNDPDLLLIDTGDALQGNMIERFRTDETPGAAVGINALDYHAFILGNHDFNYEFDTLCNAIDKMNAEVLSANIKKDDGSCFVRPYMIKEVNGVRVAVIGFTTPQVPAWESSNPDHYNHMTFTDPISEIESLLDEVEPLADLIILAAHDGRNAENESSGFYAVADRFGGRIDGIFTGHEHAEYVEERNGVLMAGSGSQGKFLMKAVFTLTGQEGSFEVSDRHAELLGTRDVEPDPDFTAAVASIHEACTAQANAVVGTVSEDFLSSTELLPGIPVVSHEDTALMDLVNQAQLTYTGADISMTNAFDPYANLKAGPFLYKDAVKLYPFDNTVKVLKVNGAQLKDIMEN